MEMGTEADRAAALAAKTSDGVNSREDGNNWIIRGDFRLFAACVKAVMCSILYLESSRQSTPLQQEMNGW